MVALTSRVEQQVEELLQGSTGAAAKLITLIEERDPQRDIVMKAISPHTNNSYLIGVTGPPGAGKSTLVGKLAKYLVQQGIQVGIIAVDPSSQVTGGALLGDRIRMTGDVGNDAGVFIRSVASGGKKGGLCQGIFDIVRVLDVLKKSVIIIETVGVGQDGVEVGKIADTSIVVLHPGTGDEIQALKSGIMEIGDLFVFNKADMEGASTTAIDIESSLEWRFHENKWNPPLVKTIATQGNGVVELWEKINAHREYLTEHGLLEKGRKQRIMTEIQKIVEEELAYYFDDLSMNVPDVKNKLQETLQGREDPHTCAQEVLLCIASLIQEKLRV